ncbi:hypothetical protein DV738_g340, partial [Chaetothyriales sp. CBS 135597]
MQDYQLILPQRVYHLSRSEISLPELEERIDVQTDQDGMQKLEGYLAYARRHGVSPTSPTFLGTRYEYVVSDTVRRLGIETVRVGQAGDRGVDLRLAKKVTPSVVRELEGSFAAAGGSDAKAVVGIVVGTMAATKGVSQQQQQYDADEDEVDHKQPDEYGLKAGRIRQVLWNHRASALGLEGIDVVKRHYTTLQEQERGDEVELQWRGRKIDDALLRPR